jgi:hypothetical protein
MAARIFRVSARYQLGTQECVNTFHVAARQGLISDATEQDYLDSISAVLLGPYRALIPTSDRFIDFTMVDPEDPANPTALRGQWVKTHNVAGTRMISDGDLPKAVCAVAKLNTDAYGRSFRGRLWLPPAVAKSQVDSQLFTASGEYMTACNALAAKFVTNWGETVGPIRDYDLTPAVYSRVKRAQGASNYWAEVTDATVGRHVRWLRSRDN